MSKDRKQERRGGSKGKNGNMDREREEIYGHDTKCISSLSYIHYLIEVNC